MSDAGSGYRGGVENKPLRVAVVSRHQLVRAGLTSLLANEPKRALVLDVASRDGHLGGHDVAIYDLAGLVGTSDNDLKHLIATDKPVIGLVPSGRQDLGEGALHAGVVELILMDVTRSDLLIILERAVAESGSSAQLRHQQRRQDLMAEFQLTERELNILRMVGQGMRNTQIADELYLSINTVKTYIRSAYKKIGATTRPEAVLWAAHHEPPPARD